MVQFIRKCTNMHTGQRQSLSFLGSPKAKDLGGTNGGFLLVCILLGGIVLNDRVCLLVCFCIRNTGIHYLPHCLVLYYFAVATGSAFQPVFCSHSPTSALNNCWGCSGMLYGIKTPDALLVT